MSPGAITSSPAWDAAGWTMLHMIWVGAILGLLGAAMRRLLWKSAPGVRYGVAVSLLGLMSVAPLVVFGWLYEPSRATSPPADPPALRVPVGSRSNSDSRSADVSIHWPEDAVLSTSGSSAGGTPSRWQAIVTSLPLLWLAGSSLTSLLLAAGLAGTRTLRRECLIIHEGEAHARAIRLAGSLGVARRFGIGVCERLASPVLLGIVRPLILLPPAALSGWTVDELEMALLHELAHLRRQDNLLNLWQCVVESLLFFHPVTWWLSGWVRLERERCCDRVVVAHTGKSRPYAELLAGLAGVSPGRVAASSLGERPLAERIRSILNKEEKPMRLTWTEGTGLVGAALLAGAMAIRAYAGVEPAAAKPLPNEAKWTTLKDLARKTAEVAIDSPESEDRVETLLEIARSQFQVGDRAAARDTIQRAEQILESSTKQAKIPSGYAAFLTKVRVADVWHAIGDTASARAALARATDDLKAATAPENRAQVLKVAEVAELAAAETDQGDPVSVLVVEFSSRIVDARIQLGDLEEARRLIAWTIQASESVKGVLRPLISAAFSSLSARAGDLPRAQALARRAEQEALTLPAQERATAIRFAARVLAECGELDRAFAILREQDADGREKMAAEFLDTFREHDPDEMFAWLDPAGIKILIGAPGTKPRGQVDALHALAARFRDVDDARVRARSLSTIAVLQAKAGRYREALETAEAIPALSRGDEPRPNDGVDGSVKPGTFAMIAARIAKAGDQPGAAAAFERSATLARAIASPGERLIALIVLADAHADAGDRPATVATVLEAAEVANPLPEPRRSRGLAMLVRTQARVGDPAGALAMIDALRDYPGVEKAQALMTLSRAFDKTGDEPIAKAMAARVLECADAGKPDGFKLGPAMNVTAFGRDTFIDPDLEFQESLARFQLSQIKDQAQGLLDVTEAEKAARAKPVAQQKGALGGRYMALGMLANNLAAKGRLDDAMRIAGSIEEPHGKLWAYQQMARAIREGGN